MAVFEYSALEARTGVEVRGRIEAPDEPSAAASLRQRALLPIELRRGQDGVPATTERRRRKALLGVTKTRDVIFFLRQLALMLRAGLTLLAALEVASENCPKKGLARAIRRIRDSVEAGSSLAQAFGAERRYLPDVAVQLIAAAEASGELDVTLDRVADHVGRNHELRQTLIGSLAYPAFLAVAAFSVAGFLVVKVIPTFSKFLEKRHVPLPWAARDLMATSAFLRANGPAIGLAAFVLVLVFVFARMRPGGRRAMDRALLSIPVIGGAASAAAMAQVGVTFALLLRGGVSLLESLRLVAGVVGNTAVSAQLRVAADRVLRGQDLASGIDHPTFTLLFVQVVGVGERTGALDHVLDEIGRFYEAELRQRLNQIVALFEPAVIVVVGGIVGFVYFAFFQALLQLASRGH